MKIPLDEQHYLNSDPQCYWITALVVPDKGKPYEKRVSGYVATFGEAVDTYIEKHIKSLEIDNIKALKREIKSLKDTVKDWKVNIDERAGNHD